MDHTSHRPINDGYYTRTWVLGCVFDSLIFTQQSPDQYDWALENQTKDCAAETPAGADPHDLITATANSNHLPKLIFKDVFLFILRMQRKLICN